MMKYKGYTGQLEYDSDAHLFHGEIIDMRDVSTFQGKSVEELEEAFKDSIDDNLDFCRDRGEDLDKPFSGKFVLKIPPKLHHEIYLKAIESGKSLNSWVSEVIEESM